MKKFNLLIVEDESELRDVTTQLFEKAAVNVIQAENGLIAWDILRNAPDELDAVLSDINMPGMDGLTLLAKARDHEIWAPFVFLTGYGDKQKAIEALRLGAFDFMEKPAKRDHMLEVVQQALMLGQRLREINDRLKGEIQDASVPFEKRAQFKEVMRELLFLESHRLIQKKG